MDIEVRFPNSNRDSGSLNSKSRERHNGNREEIDRRQSICEEFHQEDRDGQGRQSRYTWQDGASNAACKSKFEDREDRYANRNEDFGLTLLGSLGNKDGYRPCGSRFCLPDVSAD